MNAESEVAVRRRRSGEEVERLVIGYRSSHVPRKENCRLHGIGLSTLDWYLHQWHRRQSQGKKKFQRKAGWWPSICLQMKIEESIAVR